jgi:hypothetical protein
MIGKVKLRFLACVAAAACGASDPDAQKTFTFGPFTLAPGDELADLCVAVTLHNTEPIYVNSAELAGAPGIHHSNWFWVPDTGAFNFPEGAFTCSDGGGVGHPFDQATAAAFGGVLFAQSTQATHELQAFPPGAAIRIPPRARIIATLHLVNATDAPLEVPLALTLAPLAERDVTTLMVGFAIENESLALPPHARSRFTVECDLTATWASLYARGQVASDHIDFKLYHALAHYHARGTALTFEAIRDDGTVDTVWSTANRIGDEMGGVLDPPFDLTGHAKLRMGCTFDNPGDATIRWGNADGEMCIAFAFSDSNLVWSAGVLAAGGDPGPSVDDSGVMSYTAPGCQIVTADATR